MVIKFRRYFLGRLIGERGNFSTTFFKSQKICNREKKFFFSSSKLAAVSRIFPGHRKKRLKIVFSRQGTFSVIIAPGAKRGLEGIARDL